MTENGHIQAKYFEDYEYSDEGLNGVKRTVIEALKRKELTLDRIEIYCLDRVSMDCLIEVAERVNQTGLGWVYRIAGKPFPPDFEVIGDERGLRLRILFRIE